MTAKQEPKRSLPKYKYPPNVLTVSMLDNLVDNGIMLKIEQSQTHFIRNLDSQKRYGKALFGAGYLLSDKAAAKIVAAKIAAKIAADQAKEDNTLQWVLSDKEMDIIKSLK
jgi:hypothetical protein